MVLFETNEMCDLCMAIVETKRVNYFNQSYKNFIRRCFKLQLPYNSLALIVQPHKIHIIFRYACIEQRKEKKIEKLFLCYFHLNNFMNAFSMDKK